uniref:Uncharacterized protein n=1 Tax=Ixodes ricinus TaxID=34613 RepID=A0A0K8RMT0_IXORI
MQHPKSIFGDFQCLLELVLNKHAKQTQQAHMTCGPNYPTDSHRIFGDEFPQCLFEKVKSSYQREQFAMSHFPFVKPEEHLFANPASLPFQYVPIGQVLNNLLQVPELLEHLLQRTEQGTTEAVRHDEVEVLQSFRDGKASKKVPMHMLHIVLYTHST